MANKLKDMTIDIECTNTSNGLVIRMVEKPKKIDHPEYGIKRLDFLYDNDKGYSAGAIQNVKFNSSDVDGKACIEYSSKTQGVQRVYREDLAALGITYNDDTFIAVKLQDKVVFGSMEARMQRKSIKTTKPEIIATDAEE